MKNAFKRLRQADKLALKQRRGVVVFLESEDDFQIIAARWFFDEGEDIWFEPADSYEAETGGGGCKAVIGLVTAARADGIRAFGLVDRDALLGDRKWSLWWEHRDGEFQAARPYGDYVRVLLRWELENYLLDPEAMATEVNDTELVSTHTAESVVSSCLECVDELKDKTAATVAAKAADLPQPPAAFGCNNPPLRGSAMTNALQDHLSKKGLSDAEGAMTTEREKIDRFDSPKSSARERWERLVRMLDGKAALKYLSCRTHIRFDERRGGLASRLFERGVPAEIRGHIEAFKTAAVYTE